MIPLATWFQRRTAANKAKDEGTDASKEFMQFIQSLREC